MVDFDRARQVMVDGQVRAGGVTEPRLISRFLSVPREAFVPHARRDLAYVDDLHWFGRAGSARFMPAPAPLAKLLHLADVAESDVVLDVGAGTGYATALLAGLAATVTGFEQDARLTAMATANLARLGLTNAQVVSGEIGQFGAERFDVVILEGMVDSVPESFFAVLKDHGRLVALVRRGPIGVAHVFIKAGGKITPRAEFNAVLPPLFAARREEDFVF